MIIRTLTKGSKNTTKYFVLPTFRYIGKITVTLTMFLEYPDKFLNGIPVKNVFTCTKSLDFRMYYAITS